MVSKDRGGGGGDGDEEGEGGGGGGGGGGGDPAQTTLPTTDRDDDVAEDEIPESETIQEAATAATDDVDVDDDTSGDGYGEWQEFERGDEQFLNTGDEVVFERDGELGEGEVRELNDGLVGVETPDGERITIEDWDIESYRRDVDELEDLRQRLREHFDHVEHSDAVEAYTNDNRYREIQDHIQSAAETAKESPAYDMDPEMETVTAILATADEDTAQTIDRLQGLATQQLPEQMTVHRGIDVDADDFLDEAEEAMESGETLSHPGFQSTSINEDVSEGFGNVRLDIETEHGVYTRAASEHAGEDEILLPAGTEYKVNDVDRETNTVEVVATGGFDFNVDVGEIRRKVHEGGLSYPEAVDEII